MNFTDISLDATTPPLGSPTATNPFFEACRGVDKEALLKLKEAQGQDFLRTKEPTTGNNAFHLLASSDPTCPQIEHVAALFQAALVDPLHLNHQGLSPLHLACENGNQRFADYIVRLPKKGSILSQRTLTQDSPLHLAIANDHCPIAYILISHGAPVNAQNNAGDTPLHLACRKGNKPLVELLLCRQALTDIRNGANQTPIDLLHTAGTENEALIKELEWYHPDSRRFSAAPPKKILPLLLRYASLAGHTDKVSWLFTKGANPNDSDCLNDEGQNLLTQTYCLILSLSSQPGLPEETNLHAKIAALLLDNGINYEFPDRLGYSPVFYASQLAKTCPNIWQYFLLYHPDLGDQLLKNALVPKNFDEVSHLLQCGATTRTPEPLWQHLLSLDDSDVFALYFPLLCQYGLAPESVRKDGLTLVEVIFIPPFNTEIIHTVLPHCFQGALYNGKTILEIAYEKGEIALKTALEYLPKPWLNYANASRQTLLHRAASEGKLDMLRLLLDAGAHPFPLDASKKTPFDCALLQNQCPILAEFRKRYPWKYANVHLPLFDVLNDLPRLQHLLSLGCNPLLSNKEGKRPVDLATGNCLDALWRAAPKAGIDENYPLHENDMDKVMLALQHGADPNLKNRQGETPLVLATKNKLYLCMQALLCNTRTDRDLDHPLFIACKSNDIEAAKLLLEAGASTQILNDKKQTLLEVALRQHFLPLAELLLKHHADPIALPDDLSSNEVLFPFYPLHREKDKSPLRCALNALDPLPALGLVFQYFPKHPTYGALTTAPKDFITLNFLLNRDADPNEPDGDGVSPFWHTILGKQEDFLSVYLNCPRTLINQRYRGQTPLHYAVSNSFVDLADQLLASKGCNVNALTSDGKTAYDIAAGKKHISLQQKLAERGGHPAVGVAESTDSEEPRRHSAPTTPRQHITPPTSPAPAQRISKHPPLVRHNSFGGNTHALQKAAATATTTATTKQSLSLSLTKLNMVSAGSTSARTSPTIDSPPPPRASASERPKSPSWLGRFSIRTSNPGIKPQ